MPISSPKSRSTVSASTNPHPRSAPGACRRGAQSAIPSGPSPAPRLGEQLFAGVGVLDGNRADRTILRCFEDLLLAVARRVDRFGLPIVVEPEDVRREGLAHRVADASGVIDADAQVASHLRSPSANGWGATSGTGR